MLILLKIIKFGLIVRKGVHNCLTLTNYRKKIFMNKLFIAFLFVFFSKASHAQYYYKDIVSNKQLTADMVSYKEKKVRTIKINSFEDDDSPSEGFLCEKTISRDYKKSELFTRSNITAISLFTSIYNDKFQLLTSTDSSQISVTHNYYSYDESDRVKKIVSSVRSNDDDFTNEIIEEHIYEYNTQNLPASMMRVKNRRDSTRILFLTDEKNNISVEKDTKNGDKYYYYYDAMNRLTDVVHANEFRENLVAVYVFEYNAANQIIQMTTTEEGTDNFFIWRYKYEDGLRIKEGLFSKNRKLLGSIEYEYKTK